MRLSKLSFFIIPIFFVSNARSETVLDSRKIKALNPAAVLEFDMVANQNNINVEIGVSENASQSVNDLAAVIRLAPSGRLDVRNRTYYASATPVPYVRDEVVHVKMMVDMAVKKYSVLVTKPYEKTVRIAPFISFRTSQSAINSINYFSVVSVSGDASIKNVLLDGIPLQRDSELAGLTFTKKDVERAKARIASKQAPFAASCTSLMANSNRPISPFKMTQNLDQLKYGWCGSDNDGLDNTVGELRDKTSKDMGTALAAASRFLLLGDKVAGAKTVEIFRRWDDEATLPTLYDMGIDFKNSKFVGMTNDGMCGARPWNLTLDFGWVIYGVKSASSAYSILKKNNYPLTAEDHKKIQSVIRKMTATLNSSLRAWTEWARFHPGGATAQHYISDNHVGIYLSGLAAAAVALEDQALMEYVINGTAYDFGNGDNLPNYVPLKKYLENALVLDATTQTVVLADIGWKANHRTYLSLSLVSLNHMLREISLNYPSEANLEATFKTSKGYSLAMANETFARYLIGELSGGSADVLKNQNTLSLEYPNSTVDTVSEKLLYGRALSKVLDPTRVPRSTSATEHDTSACLIGVDD